MARIFLSYRRDDSAGHAGRIFDHLSSRFGEGRVFIDVEGIEAGDNFVKAIEHSIANSDTVVAVIGRGWAGDAPSGGRRIDDARDYVRQEIETTLRLGVELVPVLVAGARMPTAAELPESLAELALRNALPIVDKTFFEGMDRLTATLEKTTARTIERRRLQRPPKPQRVAKPVEHRPTGLWMQLRRLLLLYTPARPSMMVVHVFFYLLLISAAASIPLTMNEPDLGFKLWTSNGAMLVVLRLIAALAEPGSTLSGNKWQPLRRALLLYAPTHPATWGVHVLFYILLVGGVFGVALGAREDFHAVLPSAAMLAAMILVVRAVALVIEPDHTTSRLRRWWLLYKPARTSTAVLHVVFHFMLLCLGAAAISVGPAIQAQENFVSSALFAESLLFIAVLTFVVREVAAVRDPLRQADAGPNWFSRLWFVSRPRRRATWIPRCVFYVGSFAFLVSLPDALSDKQGNLAPPWLGRDTGSLVLAALFLLLAVAAHGAARSADSFKSRRAAPRTATQRIRRLLLLHAPSSVGGYAPQMLFWLSMAFVIQVFATQEAAMIRLDVEPTAWRFVGAITLLIAACAHVWARMFVRVQPPGVAEALPVIDR